MTKSMTIPVIRERVLEIAKMLRGFPELTASSLSEAAIELELLAEEMRRRPPVTRSRAKSTRMTPEVIEAIKRYAAAFPDKSQVEIARAFNVNPGRVSEALAGKR